MTATRFRPARRTWRRARFLAVLAVVLWAAVPAAAQDRSQPGGFTADQTQGIEQIIRRYLLENPDVVIEALAIFQQQQKQAESEQRQQALIAYRSALAEDPDTPVLGNPDGDVVMVEFFDYRCPYCRRVAESVKEVVEADGNIRLVMKEYPILGPQSVRGARAALAAAEQGKYEAFHFALMTDVGDMSDPHIFRVARAVGLDVARLERDMESEEVDRMIRRNLDLGDVLGIGGTPAFVIGEFFVPGAVDKETLRRLVAETRSKAS